MSESNDVSKQRSIRILLLEDNAADADLSLRHLRRGGFQVEADIVRTQELLAKCLLGPGRLNGLMYR